MKREEAIINAGLCENYLASFYKEALLTKDISKFNVSVHFVDMTKDKEQVKKVAKELETLRIVGSEVEFIMNDHLNILTFTIYWYYE